MTSISIKERSHIAKLRLDDTRRQIISRLLLSPIYRWAIAEPEAEHLLLVPRELRALDASFVSEIRQGMFGLGGTVASMGDSSIFDIKPPNPIWDRNLHGFSWLRHLSGIYSATTTLVARRLIEEWLERFHRWEGLAWQPEVVGRRIFSWIANADFLLQGCTPEFYDKFLDSLSIQMKFLSVSWFRASAGLPRLSAVTGLTLGDFCIDGRQELLKKSEYYLALEIERQFYKDGGHISRNPDFVVEALLDLIPLRSCYQSYGRSLPKNISEAIPRMLRFVQFMRLGDGNLAHFHGAGASSFHTLSMLSTYADNNQFLKSDLYNLADNSGYVRLTGGDTVLIFDGSKPPPLQFAANATSCCLSFEFSVGAYPMLVNGGTPSETKREWLARSRSTASHNTLVLGAQSSSEIINHKALLKLIGNAPLRLPKKVLISVECNDKASILDSQHDGYLSRLGLLHKRQLKLSSSGYWLEGIDQIISAEQTILPPRDISFSIHFHLHPMARCLPETSSVMLEISLPNNSLWRFTAHGATLSLEESIYYADLIGPTSSQQIVLRGSCFNNKTVRWRLEKLK
ncbi:MAG: FtsZ-localized protein C [Hyphomicrobiaceae bacterium hypho_1]